MNASDLKAEVISWLRYVRKLDIVCTEVGPYKADCWGVDDTRIIEVETKVTFADLRADLKKRKHVVFARSTESHGVPNLFYFAVPPDLVDKATAFLAEHAAMESVGSYGLMCIPRADGYLGRQAAVVKPAKKLHQAKPTEAETREALMRMGSEICGLHDSVRRLHRSFDAVQHELANTTQLMYKEADKLREARKGEDDGTTEF